jgi:hypothetical protein
MREFIEDYEQRLSSLHNENKNKDLEYFEVYQIFSNCLNEYLKYFHKKLNDVYAILNKKGENFRHAIICRHTGISIDLSHFRGCVYID